MVKPFLEARKKAAGHRRRDLGKWLNVLIVDDEPDVCQVLKTALVAFGGCSVSVEYNAKAALDELGRREDPFDGIFLDIQMPGKSGVELCSIIKAMPVYRNIPIIMLTAMTEQHHLREAFAAGASDYVTKPFDLADIKFRFSQERMTAQRRKGFQEALRQSDATPNWTSVDVIRDLSDAISVPGVERCITKEAFENYVLKTIKQRAVGAYVRATKISCVFELYSQLPTVDFKSVIVEIARVLSDQTTISRELISYIGNGVFLSLRVGSSDWKLTDLSKSVKNSPMLSNLASSKHQLRLMVGREVPLNVSGASDPFSALQFAIEAAENAESKSFGWHTYREWLTANKSIGEEQRHYQEAGYKKLLNDIIIEGERS